MEDQPETAAQGARAEGLGGVCEGAGCCQGCVQRYIPILSLDDSGPIYLIS